MGADDHGTDDRGGCGGHGTPFAQGWLGQIGVCAAVCRAGPNAREEKQKQSGMTVFLPGMFHVKHAGKWTGCGCVAVAAWVPRGLGEASAGHAAGAFRRGEGGMRERRVS